MGNASFIPDRIRDLSDCPSSFTGQTLKHLRVNSGETALEFADVSALPSITNNARKRLRVKYDETTSEWYDEKEVWVTEYGASGSITTTTLAADLSVGSTSATLADASTFAKNHGLLLPGAGVAGADLIVILTSVAGNVVSWATATSTAIIANTTVFHDDTTAFQNAIASGKNVYIPVHASGGGYNITDTLKLSTYAQALVGPYTDGNEGYANCIIYIRSNTKDVLWLAADGVKAIGFNINVGSGFTQTAGNGILLGIDQSVPGAGGRIAGAIIDSISVSNTYDGLKTWGVSSSNISNSIFYNNKRYGIYYSTKIPRGANRFFKVFPCYATVANIYIDAADFVQWVYTRIDGGLKINAHGIYMKSDNQISNQIFTQLYMDNIGTGAYVLRLEKTTAQNNNHHFHEFIGGGQGGGAYVGAGVADVTINNFHAGVLYQHGLEIYGTRISVVGGGIRGELYNATGYDALKIYNGANGVIVTGFKGTRSRWGITIAAGAINCVITGNNFQTNSEASSIAAGVLATCIIKNNLGLTDYLTSTAATPDFVGQEALVSGQWYKAKATTAPTDWILLG